MKRIVLVPGVLALSSRYASAEDPVAELRAAVKAALTWVGEAPRIVGDAHGVIADVIGDLNVEVAAGVSAGSASAEDVAAGLVVVANGSAKRSDKAPGHFDERAQGFDDWLREALTVDPGQFADLPAETMELAEQMWADIAALPVLAEALSGAGGGAGAGATASTATSAGKARLVSIDYDGDPFGVKYWVIRWEVS